MAAPDEVSEPASRACPNDTSSSAAAGGAAAPQAPSSPDIVKITRAPKAMMSTAAARARAAPVVASRAGRVERDAGAPEGSVIRVGDW